MTRPDVAGIGAWSCTERQGLSHCVKPLTIYSRADVPEHHRSANIQELSLVAPCHLPGWLVWPPETRESKNVCLHGGAIPRPHGCIHWKRVSSSPSTALIFPSPNPELSDRPGLVITFSCTSQISTELSFLGPCTCHVSTQRERLCGRHSRDGPHLLCQGWVRVFNRESAYRMLPRAVPTRHIHATGPRPLLNLRSELINGCQAAGSLLQPSAFTPSLC